MKKFTKGCLITALVLFIVGLIICGVGGLLGGFRELSEMDGIGSIPFRYYRNVESDWIGFYDEKELERLENIEDIENMADWKSAELEGKKEQLALTADTLGSITIDLKECNLVIRESADEHVWISVDGSQHETYYAIEDGKSGFLVPVGDYKRGAEIIIQVMAMGKEERNKIGDCGRQYIIKKYNSDRISVLWEKHLIKILE